MRNVRDIDIDLSSTSVKQNIPVYSSRPSNLHQGSIFFNSTTNQLEVGNVIGKSYPIGSRVIGTMNTGVTPAGVAITPNGLKAYVANNANYTSGYPQTTNSVTVFDLNSGLPIKTITDASFNQPYTVTINSAGTAYVAYITNSAGTTITIIDTVTDTVTGTITGFDGPSGMVISPSGTRAYVNNYGATPGVGSGNGNTVSVVDMTLPTPGIISTITLVNLGPPAAPAAITISPNGQYVYTANYVNGLPNNGTLSKIHTTDNSVLTIGPFVSGFSGPFDIVITPDGTKAVVTNFGSNNFVPYGTTVSIVDLNNDTIITNVNGGIQPASVAITPNGKYAYFTNYNTLYTDAVMFTGLTAGQGTVNIIDLTTNSLVPPTIAVGQSPAGIAISPDGTFALVTNYISGTVSIISV